MTVVGRRPVSTVHWGRVTETIEKALIVASGPSAKEIDWKTLKVDPSVSVISVNGTLKHVPQATHWFTIDLSVMNKEVMHSNRNRPVKFYAGAFESYIRTEPWVTFLRRRTGNGKRNACLQLSEDPAWIACGNSAYGALNLAYLMQVKKVALIGVDGTWKYWYGPGGPSGDLSIIRDLFSSVVPQLEKREIEVVNGSPNSIVDCFLRVKPQDAIDWINSV